MRAHALETSNTYQDRNSYGLKKKKKKKKKKKPAKKLHIPFKYNRFCNHNLKVSKFLTSISHTCTTSYCKSGVTSHEAVGKDLDGGVAKRGSGKLGVNYRGARIKEDLCGHGHDVVNHVNNNSRSKKVAGKRSLNWIRVVGWRRCKKGHKVVSNYMLWSLALD
jgi:hypothetical protein